MGRGWEFGGVRWYGGWERVEDMERGIEEMEHVVWDL